MAAATPFPEPWGFDKLIGSNSTDIFGAATDVWRQSATQGIALDFTFGFIPLLLITVVYIRTKKIIPSLLTGLVSTYGLRAFNLITPTTSKILFIIIVVGLGLNLAYILFNKT